VEEERNTARIVFIFSSVLSKPLLPNSVLAHDHENTFGLYNGLAFVESFYVLSYYVCSLLVVVRAHATTIREYTRLYTYTYVSIKETEAQSASIQ